MTEDQEDPPLVLYKYRPANWPHLEDLLLNKRVWFSTASELNDPFECRPIVEPTPETEREELIEAILSKAPEGVPTSQEHRAVVRQRVIAMCEGGDYAESIIVKRMVASGVFSLSEDPCNAVMWAAYGGDHTGCAIQFDVNALISHASADMMQNSNHAEMTWAVLPVEYQVQRPVLNARKAYLEPGLLTRAVCTKSVAWKHEAEWRCLVSAGGGLQTLPEGALSGLVFGLRPSLALLLQIKGLLEISGDDLQVYQVLESPQGSGDGATGYELELVERGLDELVAAALQAR